MQPERAPITKRANNISAKKKGPDHAADVRHKSCPILIPSLSPDDRHRKKPTSKKTRRASSHILPIPIPIPIPTPIPIQYSRFTKTRRPKTKQDNTQKKNSPRRSQQQHSTIMPSASISTRCRLCSKLVSVAPTHLLPDTLKTSLPVQFRTRCTLSEPPPGVRRTSKGVKKGGGSGWRRRGDGESGVKSGAHAKGSQVAVSGVKEGLDSWFALTKVM